MIALHIPVEFERWHISRLITLIRVCEENNSEPEKMSKADVARENARLNAARKAKFKSKG